AAEGRPLRHPEGLHLHRRGARLHRRPALLTGTRLDAGRPRHRCGRIPRRVEGCRPNVAPTRGIHTMRAAVLNSIPGTLEIEDVEIGTPGPREVLVRVA